MHSVWSTVERRFESYSGSHFLVMKAEYVVVAEQAKGCSKGIIAVFHHPLSCCILTVLGSLCLVL